MGHAGSPNRSREECLLTRRSTYIFIAVSFALTLSVTPATAQTPTSSDERASIAVESDILSFFISGYSAMINVSLPNKFQAAFGIGTYDVPSFLLEGDDNFDAAQWEARVTSVQVFRATYRFRGPRRSGPALGGVILNQNWRLESAPLNGQTTFRDQRWRDRWLLCPPGRALLYLPDRCLYL